MASAFHRVSALTLAREEIRTLPRQTFALGAVAVLLAIFAPLAAGALEGTSAMRDYLMFLWVVAQLVVAIVLAARVAAARRTRFVESLYTTPLQPRSWLAAQALVGAALAGLVLLAQVPFILVHVGFVGVPDQLLAVFAAALGTAAFAVAFGLFCGVVVGDSGPGAAAGLAGGVGFLSFILLLVHGVMAMNPPSPTQAVVLRLTALSPVTLAVDATGIDPFGIAPGQPWRAVAGLAALVLGLGGAAWVAYTRGQGPLGWEPRRARAPVVALVALALLVPVATASVAYVEQPEEGDWVLQHGEHTRVAFVPRGAPITDEHFEMYAFFMWDELEAGRDNERDALVMLMVPEGEAVRDVRIEVKGSDTLLLVDGGRASFPTGAPEGRARAGESFDDDAVATGPLRPVYRVPVVLRPVDPVAIRDSPGLVEVETTFTKGGAKLASHTRMTLDSDVPGGSLALLAAGTPLPLAAFAALVTRRLRTR